MVTIPNILVLACVLSFTTAANTGVVNRYFEGVIGSLTNSCPLGALEGSPSNIQCALACSRFENCIGYNRFVSHVDIPYCKFCCIDFYTGLEEIQDASWRSTFLAYDKHLYTESKPAEDQIFVMPSGLNQGTLLRFRGVLPSDNFQIYFSTAPPTADPGLQTTPIPMQDTQTTQEFTLSFTFSEDHRGLNNVMTYYVDENYPDTLNVSHIVGRNQPFDIVLLVDIYGYQVTLLKERKVVAHTRMYRDSKWSISDLEFLVVQHPVNQFSLTVCCGMEDMQLWNE